MRIMRWFALGTMINGIEICRSFGAIVDRYVGVLL